MPLTAKGKKIMKSMKKSYGSKKGESVFYASQNKGTIEGTHEKSHSKAVKKQMKSQGAAKAQSKGGY